MKKLSVFFLVMLLIFFNLAGDFPLKARASGNKRVLYISSYTQSFPSVADQIEGIKEVLDSQGILLDIEYMDAKRLDTPENLDLFYSLIKYKLQHVEPYDAIIVGDDHALDFALKHQEELFAGKPIVFLCVNDLEKAELAAQNKYITGIIEENPLKENIELALKFNPEATRVVAILDNTLTGLGDKHQYYNAAELFPNLKFEDLNASDYTFEEMTAEIEKIQQDAIILYINMYTDKTGRYITINQAAEFFQEHAKVPVYRASIGGVGKGLLGGKMISYVKSGQMAATMVLDVLNGTDIAGIDLVRECPTYYIFDYNMIKKFQINEKLIPPDALLINKKITFFEEYHQLVLGTLAVIAVLGIISIILVIDNIRRRAIQKELRESHEELTAIYEELAATEEELRHQYKTIENNAQKTELLNQKYEHSINSTNSVVWELDINSRDIYFSSNINVFGLALNTNENIDLVLNQLLDEDSKKALLENVRLYEDGTTDEINISIPIMSNQSKKWVKIKGKGIIGAAEEEKLLFGILSDETKEKEQEEFIHYMAHFDYLTNLPNRMAFMRRLQEEVEKENPLLVLMMDIDNFKVINDTVGHIYGDEALIEIALRLTDLKGDEVFVSRFGGDEFLLLISDADGKGEGRVRKIQEKLKKPVQIGQGEYIIKYSMGITRYPADSTDVDQLIMNADTAMYNVKHGGKDGYLFYNQEMQAEIRKRAEILGILQKAVDENGFYLVYQPQVDVKTGEIAGFEALLRIKGHVIPPQVFIQIAEETDLIFHIGRIVTKEAIRQVGVWKEMGYLPKTMALNFSSKQIKDKHYLEFLIETLERYNVDPSCLEIEITESILLEETENTLSFLEELKKIGVKIALDDFGTGFSSINYLTYIPVDKIKLDKTLCDRFLRLESSNVIDCLISLVHSLNLIITAEGVEEKTQYRLLKESGCDYVQGYLFSKPIVASEIEKIYETIFRLDEE